ncbi:MAG: hypothetical protein K0R26_2197 [Bacteroidota bacterium]|jgi:hypothetical protein|nr:hypothetical protein [Bacteroidota bacterium]
MKKILLTAVTVFSSVIAGAQCLGTFTCNIIPTAAANGKVIMYRTDDNGGQMDSVNYKNVTTPTFTIAIPDSGKYVLKFVPSSPSYQVTYADSAQSWNEATVYTNPCFANLTAYFFPQTYASLGGSGNGSISGKVVEGLKYGQKTNGPSAPGNPIGGIIIKGGKNPGGQLFAQTETNANGDYFFNNLPAGDYFILVDIPGLDTASTHHVSLNNNQISNLGFTVDSLKIVPTLINSDVSVNELNHLSYSSRVYPNPSSSYFTIEYILTTESPVQMDLFDLLGKHQSTLMPRTIQTKGEYKQVLPSDGLESGIYYMKLKVGQHELIYKLFVVKE